jgi:hypothetical protein
MARVVELGEDGTFDISYNLQQVLGQGQDLEELVDRYSVYCCEDRLTQNRVLEFSFTLQSAADTIESVDVRKDSFKLIHSSLGCRVVQFPPNTRIDPTTAVLYRQGNLVLLRAQHLEA